MSRRRIKAWEELLARHRFVAGGDEEYFWTQVAGELGLTVEDFQSPASHYHETGDMELDVGEVSAAAKEFFFDRNEGAPPPLVMVTLKCQRCDRRLDTLRVRANGWIAPQPGSGEGWQLEDLKISSEEWSNQVGDSTSELFRKFEGRSLRFPCACGCRDIQFSMDRLRETLSRLIPDEPRWSRGGDEAFILRPATRHATIRG